MRPDKVNKYLNRRMQQRGLLGQHGKGSAKILLNDLNHKEFESQSSFSGYQKEEGVGAKSILRNFIKGKITKKKEIRSQTATYSSLVSHFKSTLQIGNENQSQTLKCVKFPGINSKSTVAQPFSAYKIKHVNSIFHKHIEDQPSFCLNTEQPYISSDDSNQQYLFRTHNKINQETAISNIDHQISDDIQKWSATTNIKRKKPDVSRGLGRQHKIPDRRELGTSVIQFASRYHGGQSTFEIEYIIG